MSDTIFVYGFGFFLLLLSLFLLLIGLFWFLNLKKLESHLRQSLHEQSKKNKTFFSRLPVFGPLYDACLDGCAVLLHADSADGKQWKKLEKYRSKLFTPEFTRVFVVLFGLMYILFGGFGTVVAASGILGGLSS